MLDTMLIHIFQERRRYQFYVNKVVSNVRIVNRAYIYLLAPLPIESQGHVSRIELTYTLFL